MARTLAGNLTGKAAQTDKRDRAFEIANSGNEVFYAIKQRYEIAVESLSRLDPDYRSWIAANIGPNDRYRDMARIVESRIGDLLAAFFCADPRTPEQRGMDADAADYAATIAGL